MQQRAELRATVLALVSDQGVRLDNRVEPIPRVTGSHAEGPELVEVAGDVAFVPRHQD